MSSRYKKLKKQSRLESDEDTSFAVGKDDYSNHALKDLEKVRAMIKFEQNKQLQQYSSALSDEDLMLAKAVAIGLTDNELLSEFRTYQQADLNRLKLNPSFVQEVDSYRSLNGFGSETTRTAKMGRVANILYEDLIENPQQIAEMSARDKIKLLNEINATFDKKNEKNSNKVDLTVIIKNRSIDENRLKRDREGKSYIDSDYPILNENGEIIGGYN